MRVLVSGHQGYLGTCLVPTLLRRGHEVVGCDTGLFRDCLFSDAPDGVYNLNKDIRVIASSDLVGFDAIIHLAALSNDPLGNLRPELTDEINHRAAVKLAAMASDAGVHRFIFASSCSVYGSGSEGLLKEHATQRPVTHYGVSKQRAEQSISQLASDVFSPCYLRAGTVYGMSPRVRFDLVLNNLLAWATATGVVRVKSDGRAWRPMVHVSDVAKAYAAALEAPRSVVHNEAFNVGRTAENYRIVELAEIVSDVVPGSRIELGTISDVEKRNYRVDCNKITDCLEGLKPQWTVRLGADEVYRALSASPVEPGDFEGRRFGRLAHIRHLIDDRRLDQNLYWL